MTGADASGETSGDASDDASGDTATGGSEAGIVDAIVIGLGPGGEDLAGRLARAGWTVVAVDAHLVGGECPYYGCIPSKMMLHESRRPDPDWDRVATRIREEATDHWDDHVAVDRLVEAGATFVRGRAELEGGPAVRPGDGGTQVTVTPGDGGAPRTWTARRAVVFNTGSESVLAPVPGLPDAAMWTHRDVVTAQALPERLAVVGGGPLGCELAQAVAAFGVQVTMLIRGDRLLSGEEPAAGELLAEAFRAEGIDVRMRTEITEVSASEVTRYESSHGLPTPAGPVRLDLSTGDRLEADRVLLATGRRPRTDLEVDGFCRVLDDGTPVAGRYAIGDVTGVGPFTHTSVAQAAIVAAQLLGGDGPDRPFPAHAVPRVTYTQPEVAAVGLSEDAAREQVGEQGWDVGAARVDLSANARGWIDEVRGSLTLVAARTGRPDEDRLLGASVVGPHAGEIIGALTVAVHAAVPLVELDRIPWAYPTLHRAIGDAVAQLLG